MHDAFYYRHARDQRNLSSARETCDDRQSGHQCVRACGHQSRHHRHRREGSPYEQQSRCAVHAYPRQHPCHLEERKHPAPSRPSLVPLPLHAPRHPCLLPRPCGHGSEPLHHAVYARAVNPRCEDARDLTPPHSSPQDPHCVGARRPTRRKVLLQDVRARRVQLQSVPSSHSRRCLPLALRLRPLPCLPLLPLPPQHSPPQRPPTDLHARA